MNSAAGGGTWAMQQLAGFLAAITRYPDVESMLSGAVHRIAEALDAEVCAFVVGSRVVACVGFPAATVPTAAILDVTAGRRDVLSAPGVGEVRATAVALDADAVEWVVTARSGDELDPDEAHLLRALAQVLSLTVQLRRSADRQKKLREGSEVQAAALRDANERLREANRLKTDLLSITSHELRTPLTSVLGFASLLRTRWADLDDDQRSAYLDIIHRHGERLLRIVEDLLTVGRLESAQLTSRPEPIELRSAARDILASHDATDVDVDGDRAVVEIDPAHLHQILTNLVDNARKYGAPPLGVEVARRDGRARLTVVDHGEGVPDGFVPSMFEPFAQASTGDHRAGSGTGLGLAIVHGLVLANRGSIEYDRRDGRTRFAVVFPDATGDAGGAGADAVRPEARPGDPYRPV